MSLRWPIQSWCHPLCPVITVILPTLQIVNQCFLFAGSSLCLLFPSIFSGKININSEQVDCPTHCGLSFTCHPVPPSPNSPLTYALSVKPLSPLSSQQAFHSQTHPVDSEGMHTHTIRRVTNDECLIPPHLDFGNALGIVKVRREVICQEIYI